MPWPLTFMSFSGGRQSWKSEYLFNRRICAWCRSSAPSGASLKRCRGCDAAVYCGRECQAAAWSRHRALCRDGSLQVEQDTGFADYATAIGLGEALNEWVLTHHYCYPPADSELGADPEAWSMFRGRKGWKWRREENVWQLMDTLMVFDRIPRKVALPENCLWTRFQRW